MKTLLACTALLALAIAPARAAVMYRFVTTSVSPHLAQFTAEVPIGVIVSDAVYLRGSVRLERAGCSGEAETCVVRTGPWDQVTVGDVTPAWGDGAIRLTFLPDGTLAGGIVEDGRDQNLTLAGTGFDWAGSRFGSDRYPGCKTGAESGGECSFTGYFFSTGPFPVPEPAGAALLGTGVLALALARRREPGRCGRSPATAPAIAPAGMPRPGRRPALGTAVRRRCGRWGRG